MIQTQRLYIRPVELSDAGFLYQLMNTEDWIKYIGDRKIYTIEDAERYIKEKQLPQYERLSFGNFVVELEGVPIGCCGVYQREGLPHCDLGFAYLPAYYRKGYAYEAAVAIMDYCDHNFDVKKLDAITLPNNLSSIQLLERLGFSYVKDIKLPNDEEMLRLYHLSRP